MNIVTVWKGVEVPEGFTYYMRGDFYNMTGTSPTCCSERGGSVIYSHYNFKFIKANGVKLPEAVELPEAKPEIDWLDAPSDTAVWIASLNYSDESYWHEPSEDGLRYNRVGSTRFWIISDDDDEYFTVHCRPMDYSNPLLKNKAAGEWVNGLPPVGCGCQVLNTQLHNAAYENCVIDFIGSHVVVYTSDSCEERFGHIDTCKFLPTKTQEEKEHDELKDFLLQHQPTVDSSMSQIDILEQYMTNLMLAGARIPKGDE